MFSFRKNLAVIFPLFPLIAALTYYVSQFIGPPEPTARPIRPRPRISCCTARPSRSTLALWMWPSSWCMGCWCCNCTWKLMGRVGS